MRALIETIERFGKPRVLVVGDFMLDRYVYGDVERINPEAPVPVLRQADRESRVGGAGKVATAVPALGGQATCLGVIGVDDGADELRGLLTDGGADVEAFVAMPDRPTAVKTRYVGLAQHRHAQQMFRVDEESTDPLAETIHADLAKALAGQFNSADVVALEDYDKGVLTGANTPALIAAARKAGKRVLVDPARIKDYSRYLGATVLTPNRYETELASGIRIVDDASLELAGRTILETTQAELLVITLDKEGAYLLHSDGPGIHFAHPHPRNVYDVSGAGDLMLAALAVAIGCDCTMDQAVSFANLAAGLEVERRGYVPITRQEVIDELHRLIGLRGEKVVSRQFLADQLTHLREEGDTVVFTNGCFDLLHMGHVNYLQQARQLGQCLVVAINSDESVRQLKGPARPVIGENERAGMLAALECVDYVTIFGEPTPEPLLELLRPDILAKGGTTPVVVGREIVEGYGGEVLTLDLVEGFSTTDIIERILAANEVDTTDQAVS
ncbi:MAG: PfkB family carbohydrate kinase [Planctomycetota bacterium]|jgi:D-beta-D-heptose 7-phosphate kinase/D-beta-D-heptose 1-phosphate adenosyltransferase